MREPAAEDDPVGHVIAATLELIADALQADVLDQLVHHGQIAAIDVLISSAYVSGLAMGARVTMADIVAGRRLIEWLDTHIEAGADNEKSDADVELWLRVLR